MNRIEILQKQLSVEALLIENPIDLFYLTGLDLSRSRLIVEKAQVRLFVNGRDLASVSPSSPYPTFLLEKGKGLEANEVGFDSNWTTVAALEALQKEAPHVQFVPLKKPLRGQRIIKSPEEIHSLCKAAKLTLEGIRYIEENLLKEGISEEEIAFEFEWFVRKRGAKGIAFESTIAFGENSAYPHHRASSTRLKKNQAVLVDVGAIIDRYSGDMTRVLFFGQAPEEHRKMYALVKEAYAAARQTAIIGAPLGSLDRSVRDVFAKAGMEELFIHSLGHGVGLEIHESPLIRYDCEEKDLPICSGMVFTIEPGLYRPGLGGARYEDSGVMTQAGFEDLQSVK